MIKCGYFDSVDRDRLYKAEDMSRPYELLISNGVFATQQGTASDYLQVYANDDMTVTVKPGRGIFKDKWLINDAEMLLTLDPSEVTLTRIDSIIVRIDTSETVRAGTIEVKKGTASSSPVAPVMERSEDVYEYRLANITIAPQTTAIQQLNISDQRGSADCPWVTSLVQQVDTSTLFEQWNDAYEKYYDKVEAKYEQYYNDNKARFDAYYTEVKDAFDSFMADSQQEFDAYYSGLNTKFDTYYSGLESKFNTYYNSQVSRFDTQYADNQTEFDGLFTEMKATVGTLTTTVSEGYYETTSDGETSVAIEVEYDTLVVYINGLHAIRGKDYTLSASTINLLNSVDAGTVVSYVAYKQSEV